MEVDDFALAKLVDTNLSSDTNFVAGLPDQLKEEVSIRRARLAVIVEEDCVFP